MWVLPILFWCFCLFFLAKRGTEWRTAFIVSALTWGGLVVVFTEFLSLFHLFAKEGLAVCWAVAILVVFTLNLRLIRAWRWRIPGEYPFSRIETTLLCGVGIICFATFVTAIVAPPNNWDSMTYHMARVVHWLQNRSVAHYPTHTLRQLELNPWAEFAITNFQALSGCDRLANLIQWFSMVGAIVAASLVVKQLGGERRAQVFTAVVVATIPMGILQASSTQNDNVVSFWLLCFVWSGMRLEEKYSIRWALMTGASLGLAILTKGTAYLYAFPFILWFAGRGVKYVPRRAATIAIVIAFLALLLSAGHYSRNFALFSNPLLSGSSSTPNYSNEIFSPAEVMSNLVRNISLHHSTPFEKVNHYMEKKVGAFHDLLGIGVNDPRTTFGQNNFQIIKFIPHGDSIGNFLHALLALTTLILLCGLGSIRRFSSNLMPYVFGVIGGFLLFCLILKWQPWGTRLQQPLFVLGAPVIGIVWDRICRRSLILLIAALLFIDTLPFALWNTPRPLLPELNSIIAHFSHGARLTPTIFTVDRNPQYFSNGPQFWIPFLNAALIIKATGARNVGIVKDNDDWDYPLWVLLGGANGTGGPRIEHIEVRNKSGTIPLGDFHPDLILRYENQLPIVQRPVTRGWD